MKDSMSGVVILFGVLCACGQPARSGNAPSVDGGVEPDAGSDGGPADVPSLSAVTGRRHEICHQVPADVDVPIDLSMALVQVLVPDGGPTGYRVLNGSSGADGVFTVAGVPDGVTFLLRLNNTYYVTDQHVIDVVSERRARCAPTPSFSENTVPVTYDLTDMTPVVQGFEFGEGLDFASVAFGYYSSGDTGRLRNGDTTAAGTLDWLGHFAPVPLVDGPAGDDLHVFHRRTEFVQDPVTHRRRLVDRIIDSLDATGVTLHEGVSTSIAGVFQPAPARALTFSIDLGPLDADAGGLTAAGSLSVGVFANAHALSAGGAALLTLGLGDRSHSSSSIDGVTNQPYGDPFPASWTRSLYLDYAVNRTYTIPFFQDTISATAHHQELRELAGSTDATASLHSPSGVTINGVDFDAGGLIPSDGQAPITVRWNPVPGATIYRVTVPYNFQETIGTFWTTDTSLKIPGFLFTDGVFYDVSVFNYGFYSLVIDAVQSPVDLRTGHALAESAITILSNEQLRLPGPIQIAGHPSGRFRFMAHCGDGEIQTGEMCDTRGESATCNVDCTLPVCGDGLRNAAAGEECDTAGDSLGCNFNCTLPRCGDGHVNFALEDCDDGNALDDGNGCSADCKFNNHCGDGILEDAAELCDPGPGGDSPICDSDCTPAVCGDGYTNRAAGEECDDPFSTEDCVQCKLR